ncbi:sulfate anion transporter 1-like isoform X1 [Ranitomeya imitator]|uniref:sulfate anion transporter 1-like isoform X1 n=2 Tax=Ranitomeya imitator TaxID=111125 RepID=UPI0037E7D959
MLQPISGHDTKHYKRKPGDRQGTQAAVYGLVVLNDTSRTRMKSETEENQVDETPTYNHLHLERKANNRVTIWKSLKTKLKNKCTCNTRKLKKLITGFLPVIQWLPKYNFKENAWGDVMSGLIIGIILVPQAIAYCLLAGLKPIYGLYTSFFANLIYFIMGTSRHVSVGIFSLISLMVGQVVDREVQLAGFDLDDDVLKTIKDGNTTDLMMNITMVNFTVGPLNIECGKECYAISIAAALTFIAGIYQILMGIFRLGFLSIYLSEPMLDGFATGASLTILTAQVKYLLGVKIPRSPGIGMIVTTWINIFKNIHNTNFCDVVTSAICITVLVAAKELGDRYKDKIKIPLPTELVVIVVATLVSHYCNLNEIYGSSVSGVIPIGFIPPKVPDFSLMGKIALDAIPLAVVSFAFTISLSEMFAKKYAYTVEANQEMFAIGFCNIIPSFFHSFATSAALAKTLVKTSTGCKTQVSSVVSALVVLSVLLFFAPLFYSLQKCVLACIIIVSLRGALRKFKDLPAQWRLNKIDAVVWSITVCSSALISTEMGLLVGIIFSMLCLIVRTQVPHTAVLSQIQDTVFYEDSDRYENLFPIPKIKIFRFESPLHYANKDYFLQSLYKKVGMNPSLEIIRRKKIEKKIKKKAKKQEEENMKDLDNNDIHIEFVEKKNDLETIILDCSVIAFLDTSGINTLKGVLKDYQEVQVSVLMACCNTSVIDALRRGAYFGKQDKDINNMLFYNIHDAVQFARQKTLAIRDSTV